MIRINLRIREAVSPSLHAALESIPRHARAERIRMLATIGLRLEEPTNSTVGELVKSDAKDAANLDDADIEKIFGGVP